MRTDSLWLSERLIARLSPLRRSNLMRQVRDHAEEAWLAVQTGTVDDVPRAKRAYALLGRLSALTAGGSHE
jgi:hypothetical protein